MSFQESPVNKANAAPASVTSLVFKSNGFAAVSSVSTHSAGSGTLHTNAEVP